jgi:hypothetical protein
MTFFARLSHFFARFAFFAVKSFTATIIENR